MDESLVRDAVGRFARRLVDVHLARLEQHPDHPLPGAVLDGLGSLGLDALDAATVEGRLLLATALERLAHHAAAPAVLCLADAAARLVVGGTEPPRGLGALPLYGDLDWADPRLTLRGEDGATHACGAVEMVVGAPAAAWLVLPASFEDDGPVTQLVVLPAAAPGVRIGASIRTLGMRGCATADVSVEDVPVDARFVVPVGEANLSRMRAPALAISLGVVDSSYRAALAYARERVQGGRPIAEHDEVRAMLGRMRAAVDVCRGAVRGLALDPDQPALFAHAREAAAGAASEGVQVLGGYGYMEDYGQERRMRDARQAALLLGRATTLLLSVHGAS